MATITLVQRKKDEKRLIAHRVVEEKVVLFVELLVHEDTVGFGHLLLTRERKDGGWYS